MSGIDGMGTPNIEQGMLKVEGWMSSRVAGSPLRCGEDSLRCQSYYFIIPGRPGGWIWARDPTSCQNSLTDPIPSKTFMKIS